MTPMKLIGNITFPSQFKALRPFIAHLPFPMPISAQHIKSAIQHLRKSDPVMKRIIKDVGPFTHKLSRNKFDMLVNSILSQQISVTAANTIGDRLRKLANENVFTAETLVQFTVDQLREAGVSRQKASYILDLSGKVCEGIINFRGFAKKENEGIIAELTLVKGIGRWTAQMFLMFAMGRLDVFPVDDLGIQNAMKKNYNLSDEVTKSELHEIATIWQPYETVASWYCWQSLDV